MITTEMNFVKITIHSPASIGKFNIKHSRINNIFAYFYIDFIALLW